MVSVEGQQEENSSLAGSDDAGCPDDRNSSPIASSCHTGGLNAGTSDPTDGRKALQWETRYPKDATAQIRCEALLLIFIFICAYALIFSTWIGWLDKIWALSPEQVFTLRKYSYYASAGLLGGITFGVKFFYRLVARGYWNQDRRLWRGMSPFIAMTVALVVGAMIDCSLMSGLQQKQLSGAKYVSIGFLSGYFADQAMGKMYEIAKVIFGTSASPKE